MSCTNFDLICSEAYGDYSIQAGATYDCFSIFYRDTDITTHTITGEIRDGFIEDGGSVLATFTFPPLTYASVTVGTESYDATIITPTLSATETSLIPGTLETPASTPQIAGVNRWLYSVKAEFNGNVILIAKGFVQVCKQITA